MIEQTVVALPQAVRCAQDHNGDLLQGLQSCALWISLPMELWISKRY